MTPKLITKEEASKLLNSDSSKPYNQYKPYLPLGLFYLQDGKKWIGIDNSTGYAWVEEFDTKEACLFWLELSISYPQYKFINDYFNKILPSKRAN